MKRKLNIRKTVTALLLMYFIFTLASQELIIHRIKEKARIQTLELDKAKRENVQLNDRAVLLRNDPDAYFEKLARDMQYIKEGENIVVNEKK